jgi:hypothetical protein
MSNIEESCKSQIHANAARIDALQTRQCRAARAIFSPQNRLPQVRIDVIGDFSWSGNFWPVGQVIFDDGRKNRWLRPRQGPPQDPNNRKERNVQTQRNEEALNERNLLDKPRADLCATDELIAYGEFLRA